MNQMETSDINFKIRDLFRLENTFKITESDHPITKPCPSAPHPHVP